MRHIKTNSVYKHFKGGLFLVENVAFDSETREKMVIYRHLFDDYSLWVRPLEMFLSEVDHEKYPDASQKYRFEEVNMEEKK